ncbi:DUF2173 family protein [Sulfuracidifex metallicus]|jgi:roadblock/LC7 domain-containing protein|uniref:DUF2173 family protein n=1 Tax=Sulfuracidifex metallicus DSM 6482 = JCM 9184 TaxID=523847 RepID=A0A6A9QJW1_SULME|nr:DUF2173 family protein [Sulfuracidifex metallicus]MCY0850634.1 DUF2173 family protein [Sulfuracidifex metallicus]MUN28389.1 DUF2173 family protein [Sulfuracidifex metallicus DSM 6482 = JCM 9184]WOE51092.1 DUF2173 family protein [Sulfuracidifex metallicus DSM 6482 = JCM 9184]
MQEKLETLMKLKGAVAAGEFKENGELVSYKGEMPEDLAKMVAMMCAANTMMAKMQAEGFSKMTGMKWSPLVGWAVAAGDYAVCVEGNYGVFLQLNQTDFNEVFKVLHEVAHKG